MKSGTVMIMWSNLNVQVSGPTPQGGARPKNGKSGLQNLPEFSEHFCGIYPKLPGPVLTEIAPGRRMPGCAEENATPSEAPTSQRARLMRLGTARPTRTVPLARPSTPVTHEAPPSLRNRLKRSIRPTGRLRTDRSGAGKRASMHLGSAERNGWYSPRLAYHRVTHAGLRRRSYVAKEAGRYTR